jgi:large repetitive protein
MKKQVNYFLFMPIAIAALFLNVACGSSNNSSSSPVAAASVLGITASQSTVAPGGSSTITVTGGVAPYTFTLSSSTGALGSINANSADSAIFVAPNSNSSVLVTIDDAVGDVSSITINVITSGSGGTGATLSVVQSSSTVALGGSDTLTVSGGSGTYTYSVITTGGGSFVNNVFTAGSTPEVVEVEITDANNTSLSTEIEITVSSSSSGGTSANLSCEGNYTFDNGGPIVTLTIVDDPSTGTIAGSILTASGTTDSISGTCTSVGAVNSINFTDATTSYKYTGSFFANSSVASQIFMSGTFVGAASATLDWFAETK